SQLTLGLPLYGYGWTGVPDGGNAGMYQSANWVAEGTTKPGATQVKNLLGNQAYYDEQAVASWNYDGSTLWSYDDPVIAGVKATYVQMMGLRGVMFFSLDGDDGRVVGAVDQALLATH